MRETSVLVVDDDEDIRLMLGDLLQLQGYTVRTAANGAEALESIESNQPSLVILDLWMPVLSGKGFVHELELRELDIPVLLMTAAPNPGQEAESLKASGYVQKPFELFDLLESVRRLCPGSSRRSDRLVEADQDARRNSSHPSTTIPFDHYPEPSDLG